jgi:hypothetical protein
MATFGRAPGKKKLTVVFNNLALEKLSSSGHMLFSTIWLWKN